MKKKTAPRWFTLIALLIPVALFLLIEFGLRLSGFGKSYPLFIPASEPGYLMPNPDLIKRYFHHNVSVPKVSPDTYYFPLQKPDNEIRIVMLGGSTAAGFPYGRFGSPSGLLEARLQSAYPDKTIRVISTAMSSVNTYTLRDISDEIVAISPDAILIYAGHNEYLGVMGVGSVYASKGGHLANLVFLKLKNWRTFQLAQSLLYSADRGPANANAERTVMASVARTSEIPLDSDDYLKGITQFQNNLEAILSRYQKEKIPVFVTTLAANESGQRPFSSSPAYGIDDLRYFLESEESGAVKRQQAEVAVANSPASADAHFALATLTAGINDELATRHFIHAMDRDLLRFRAPSVFNKIIRALAEKHQSTLVDVHRMMAKVSSGGYIGYNLMLEHLHPNERGYFIIADALYEALVKSGLLPTPTLPVTAEEAWQQRPLTTVDSLLAKLKIESLTSDYPFTAVPERFSLPESQDTETQLAVERFKGAGLLSQLPAIITGYQQQGRWREAANAATALATALPFNAETSQLAAKIALRADQPGRAWFFSRQAVALDKDNISYQLTLAESQFKSGKRNQAIKQLKSTQQQFPDNPKPEFFLRQVGALQ